MSRESGKDLRDTLFVSICKKSKDKTLGEIGMSRHLEQKRLRKARRKRRILITKIVLVILVLALIIAGCIHMFLKPKVAEELTREAGSTVPVVSDFLKKDIQAARIVSGLDDSVNMNAVADYEVVIEIDGKEYTSVLHVVDTVKPEVTAADVLVCTGEKVEPEDLLEEVLDATSTTAAFVGNPDFSKAGKQQVGLTVTDEGGNVTTVTVEVEVVEDTEAPVISGVEELTVAAGSSVSYKRNVTVTDNYDDEVELTVDNSEVNLNAEGDYPITYIARDTAGNETTETTILHVTMPAAEQATEELINALADELLARITTEDMSEYEKAEAIFNWVHGNIGYSDGTSKTDWIQGAYHGLVEHSGDCYVYAMTSKVLLTRAGITNMDIEKIPTSTHHYWNLIDIGEGWYHFDATRRKDGQYFFYSTDEEVMAYSNTHRGSHNYDSSAYPKIQ